MITDYLSSINIIGFNLNLLTEEQVLNSIPIHLQCGEIRLRVTLAYERLKKGYIIEADDFIYKSDYYFFYLKRSYFYLGISNVWLENFIDRDFSHIVDYNMGVFLEPFKLLFVELKTVSEYLDRELTYDLEKVNSNLVKKPTDRVLSAINFLSEEKIGHVLYKDLFLLNRLSTDFGREKIGQSTIEDCITILQGFIGNKIPVFTKHAFLQFRNNIKYKNIMAQAYAITTNNIAYTMPIVLNSGCKTRIYYKHTKPFNVNENEISYTTYFDLSLNLQTIYDFNS